ncbi:MAG TPA: hypothetical protein VFC15_16320 [Candidatus Limnocylindrales bacterium]|nr:hypothetical protein [Candidatus Limnocylindrales bacterium]
MATWVSGISDSGDIVGYYNDGTTFHGFLLSKGKFTGIQPPASDGDLARGINARGDIVGQFGQADVPHCFLYRKGTYIIVDPPGSTLSFGRAINARGDIVGYYADSAGANHGFAATR